MIGDRTDPHRFGEWDDLTIHERDGQCVDLLQDITRRITDMQKALVRKKRSNAQQFTLERCNLVLSDLNTIREQLLQEMKHDRTTRTS